MAVEYPQYGLYEGRECNEENILNDIEGVLTYCINTLGFEQKHIIVVGRSIGSGPACHIASMCDIGALVLLSPFTSIKCVVGNIAGSLGKALFKQRFDNQAKIPKVKAPILIIHGDQDKLIPLEQSQKLQEATNGKAKLHINPGMKHEISHFADQIYGPMCEFLYSIELL